MKKGLIVLLVLMLSAFALTGCSGGGDEEAYALYSDMMAAMEDVSSLETNMDMKMAIESGGEKMDVNMEIDLKQIIHSETDIEMAMVMSMDMGELGAMDITSYFKDGFLYQEMMGMKYKMALPLDEVEEMIGSDSSAGIVFAEDAIASSKVTEVSGGKELSFTLKGEAINDILTEMTASAFSSLGDIQDMTLNFKDVTYSMIIDENNLPTEQHISFAMDLEMYGEKASATYIIDMTGLTYNKLTEISYPADLDEYMEMEM